MMTILKKLIPAVLVGFLMTGSAWAQTKIATVDMQRVFTNYWKTKEADNSLQQRLADLTKVNKEMIDTYQKLKDEYDKLVADANNQEVSAAERDRRSQAAEQKRLDTQKAADSTRQFEIQAKETLNTQRMRVRDTIVAEIRTAINARAKAGGYHLVIDSAAQSTSNTPILLYSTAESDLTEQVLAQLNSSAPIPAARTERPPERQR